MSEQKATSIGFSKRNFVIMGIGLLIVALSYFLISGGRSAKDSFEPAQIFSFVRITLAPIMIFAGFAIIGWGILARDSGKECGQADRMKRGFNGGKGFNGGGKGFNNGDKGFNNGGKGFNGGGKGFNNGDKGFNGGKGFNDGDRGFNGDNVG